MCKMKVSALCTIIIAASFLIYSNLPASDTPYAFVTNVVDGDTLDVTGLGRVRLIGVDTPETKHPKKPVEYFGVEASNYLKKLATGKKVKIEFDQQMTDKYGRTLAYLYLEDGTLINAAIIKNGYGHAYTRFPFKKMEEFRKYEREARLGNKGLWASTDQKTNILAIANIQPAASIECKRKTCRQIASCSEARMLLEKCKFKSLDRDGDGTPCANLCR